MVLFELHDQQYSYTFKDFNFLQAIKTRLIVSMVEIINLCKCLTSNIYLSLFFNSSFTHLFFLFSPTLSV